MGLPYTMAKVYDAAKVPASVLDVSKLSRDPVDAYTVGAFVAKCEGVDDQGARLAVAASRLADAWFMENGAGMNETIYIRA